MDQIQFIDLGAQQDRLRTGIDRAIAEVLDTGAYIMGPHVKTFERDLAAFCGARHAISCANGTDALQLALMALNIGPGDAVFVPSFTFAASAETVALVGATPIFVDSDFATFNMDVASLKRAIERAENSDLSPRAIMPVDLFGLPAPYDAIERLAEDHELLVLCDSAQGFGGTIGDRMTGTFGKVTTTSFFPAKPLGCYGDGGAVFTDDDELASILDSLRVHGKGTDKYDNVRIGLNSRLDTLQAAILSVKLSVYADEIQKRQTIAARYNDALADVVRVPTAPEEYGSVWAQYTVLLPSDCDRQAVQSALADRSIPSAVYYPKPLHMQSAYQEFPADPEGLPQCEQMSASVLSLPMHPYLETAAQDRIIAALRDAVAPQAQA